MYSSTASHSATHRRVRALILQTLLLVVLAVGAADRASAHRPSPGPDPVRSGYVEANGVNYYYEIHGEGEPMLLLHGGLGSIDMFGPVLPLLAQNRQVIGVDLHGHGRTALGDRPIGRSGDPPLGAAQLRHHLYVCPRVGGGRLR